MKQYSNMTLIAGNGRNVGKTLLACRIIETLSTNSEVYAVKVSSHFHILDDEAAILYQSDDFCIVEENLLTGKDSSRMLQAGARKVFYVQCKNQNLPKMFEHLSTYLPDDKPVIIESGGLYNIIEPHIFYYIKGDDTSKEKKVREGNNKVIVSPGEALELDVQALFETKTQND